MSQNMSGMSVQEEEKTARSVQLVYGLYALNLAVPGPFGLAGVIIAYLQRDMACGSWLESHVTWQIRTFWLSILFLVIGLATIVAFGLGILILLLIWPWSLMRMAVGWSAASKGRPIANPYSWFF